MCLEGIIRHRETKWPLENNMENQHKCKNKNEIANEKKNKKNKNKVFFQSSSVIPHKK